MASDGDSEPPAEPAALAGLLRLLRQRALLSQEQLAERAGLSVRTIVGLESGRIRRPHGGSVRLLADALGLTEPDRVALAAAARNEATSVAARTPAPTQLPADIGDFTGRADAIAQLDAWAADDRAAGDPVLLTGGAGVGKTALAVHWGWRVASRFGDGQLYVDLRGWAAGSPLQPTEALSLFLRALGVAPERVPVDLAEASGLYRTLLAGRQVLVVLDDAGGPGQVRPLLPGGPGNLVVITSRERLSGMVAREGARRLALGTLDEPDALALLARIAGAQRVEAEPAAAARLARLCAYLPLALRIAAANLSGHPGRCLADLVAELHGDDWPAALDIEGDPEAQVHGAFDVSYAAQEPAARRQFRLLGLVPGPDFTRGDAVALAQGAADPGRLLDLLTDANLVDQPAPGRFALHDLLRRYAVERAEREESQAERDRAVGRLYQRYLAAADEAARLVSPQLLRLPRAAGGGSAPAPCFAGRPEALAWLDAERVNLVAAARRAAGHGPAEVCWLLADALRGYFALRRHMGDWLGTARAALSAAETVGAAAAQVSARFSLSQALWWLGRHSASVEQLTQALALARRIGWHEAEASCLGNLGGVHGTWGRMRDAARYLAEAIETRRRHGLPAESVANNLTNLGAVCYDLGRLAEAAEHQARAIALYGGMGARVGEAQARANLGQALLDLGEPAAAAGHLAAAREVLRECGERSSEAAALADLARLRLETGQEGEAARLAELALAAAREAGAGHNEATALDVLGLVQRSPARHQEALQVARAAGVRHTEVRVLLGFAETLAALHRFAEAAHHGQQALAHARLAGFRALEGVALAVLAEVHAAQGRSAEARELARQVLVIREETGYDRLRRGALAITGDDAATGRAAGPGLPTGLR